MPKKPKSGPPYTDIPDAVYVVVINPWGTSEPRERGEGDFNRVASWAQFALQEAGVTGGLAPIVECIYSMGTRDEIILQFPKDTNIVPLLGEHRWADFWKYCPPNDHARSTRVFRYNWRNNGDPANHNWTENFPTTLPLDKIPIRTPYPTPSPWAPTPHSLANFVYPLPRPLPIPNHAREPGREQDSETSPLPSMETLSSPPARQTEPTAPDSQATTQDSATHLFRPYEPHSQHPSHAHFLDQSPAKPSPSPKFVKKLDPYELEEDAVDFIRAFKSEEDTEFDSEYKPSQALIEAFSSLREQEQPPSSTPLAHDPRKLDAEVKAEQDDTRHDIGTTSGYQPSQELIDAFNSLRQHEQPAPSAPQARRSPASGLDAIGVTTTSSPSGSESRSSQSTIVVKREYEDDVSLSPVAAEKRKKIKIEQG